MFLTHLTLSKHKAWIFIAGYEDKHHNNNVQQP